MPAREVAVVVFSKSGFKVSEHFQEHKRKKLFSLYKHNNELFVLLNWKRRLFLGNKIIKPKKNLTQDHKSEFLKKSLDYYTNPAFLNNLTTEYR